MLSRIDSVQLTLAVLLGGALGLAGALLFVPEPESSPFAVELAEAGPGSPAAWPPAEIRRLPVAGRERTYQVYRPAGLADGAPLWLVLHGSGGSGEEVRLMHAAAFDRLADRRGIVVAYPDGYDEHWNDCRPRADYSANLENVDDVAFLTALVDTLHVDEGIDLERVTVIGLSNGGQMAFRLAFEVPELAQVYAALLANLPTQANDDCHHAGRPVPMLLINGSEDPISPAQGGLVNLAGNTSRGAVLSAEDTALAFARLAGHASEPTVQTWPERAPADGTAIESWEWKADGRPSVAWIRVIGGGHSVPTTAPLPVWPAALAAAVLAAYGRQSTEFETAEIIFDFSSSARNALL